MVIAETEIMERSRGVSIDTRIVGSGAGSRERLPLRWALPAIGALALIGWGAVLIPLAVLLHL
jgi:hypothetical protein